MSDATVASAPEFMHSGRSSNQILTGFLGLAAASTPIRLNIDRTRTDESVMEKSGPAWGLFQWIVGGLLFVIAVLVGVIYTDMRGSIKEATDGLSTLRVDIAKQLGDLKAEVAVTNSKLDQVVDRLDRLRTR
jgi:hypothetical protein